jgi:D-serine deaminase-like pyridoxal phosphate-dependent protein
VARLKADGLSVPRVVIGGSASFPIHAKRPDLVCSPGTTVFWDYNYQHRFPELEFEVAALVLARVISHPVANRLCVDLGYKAISADQPQPRVHFLNLGPFDVVSHSEEHLTIESPAAEPFAIGDVLYGVPSHICPTVALYQEAVTVRGGRAGQCWPVTARDRRLEF